MSSVLKDYLDICMDADVEWLLREWFPALKSFASIFLNKLMRLLLIRAQGMRPTV